MPEKYPSLLVTKNTHETPEKLEEVSKSERRTLNAINRNIIEDYLDGVSKDLVCKTDGL